MALFGDRAIERPSGDGEETSTAEFANAVYGVKFDFTSGGPGYCGDMFILMGDALSAPPMVLIRDDQTKQLKAAHLD